MRTRTIAALALVLATLGCKGGENGTTTPVGFTLPEPSDPRAVLESQYAAFQAGDSAGFTAFYADDAFSFGPLASDTFVGASAPRQSYAAAFQHLNPDSVASTNLQLHTVGANCAWAFDQVTASRVGATPRNFFVTSLLEREGDRWQIAAQSWSLPVRPTFILYRANRNEWPAIAEVSESVGGGAEGPRDQIRSWLESKAFEPLSGRTDSIVIAAWPNDERVGDPEVVEALGQLQRDSNFLLSPLGGARSQTTCGGEMAYVAFGQQVEMRSMSGPTIIVPTRGLTFWVNDGGLRILMVQMSLGFPSYPE